MRTPVQTKTGTQMLFAIALFCFSASLAALFAIGYSLIALVLNAAGFQIGSIYSAHGM